MKKTFLPSKKRIITTAIVSALLSGTMLTASASNGLVTLSSQRYIDADDGTTVTRVFDAADLEALNTSGGTLQSTVSMINTNISTVENSVTSMSSDLGNIETDIDTLQDQIYGTGGTPTSPADGSLVDKVNDLTAYGLGNAAAGDILNGKIAYVNGNAITGTMNDHSGNFNVTIGNETDSFVHADSAATDASNNYTGVTATVPFTNSNSGYYNGTMTLDASSIANDYYDSGYEIGVLDGTNNTINIMYHGEVEATNISSGTPIPISKTAEGKDYLLSSIYVSISTWESASFSISAYSEAGDKIETVMSKSCSSYGQCVGVQDTFSLIDSPFSEETSYFIVTTGGSLAGFTATMKYIVK